MNRDTHAFKGKKYTIWLLLCIVNFTSRSATIPCSHLRNGDQYWSVIIVRKCKLKGNENTLALQNE